MKTLKIAILVALAPASINHAGAAEHTRDSLETVQKALAKKSAIVLDVREKDEWDAGHLREARFIPLSALKKGIERKELLKRLPPADKQMKLEETIIYVHCAAGGRCLPAAEILRKQGFDARPLRQGYDDLVKAGFPKAEKAAAQEGKAE